MSEPERSAYLTPHGTADSFSSLATRGTGRRVVSAEGELYGRWFHYCCDHSVSAIKKDGWVRPMVGHPLLNNALISWLTDLDAPDRDGLGLTSETISCDRTAWRVTVEGYAWYWPHWARLNPVRRDVRDALEGFGRPAHWYVAEKPIRVVDIERVGAS